MRRAMWVGYFFLLLVVGAFVKAHGFDRGVEAERKKANAEITSLKQQLDDANIRVQYWYNRGKSGCK